MTASDPRRRPADRLLAALLWGLLFMAGGCADTPPPEPAEPEDLKLQIVSEVPGAGKQELFERAKIWVTQSFSDTLDVIQYSDRYQGKIIAKSSFPYTRPGKLGTSERYEFRFGVLIETKDGKFRTTFTDMALVGFTGYEPLLKSDIEAIRPKLESSVQMLVDSFAVTETDDDW